MKQLQRPEEIGTRKQIRDEIAKLVQNTDSPFTRKRIRALREELTNRVVLQIP